jgi:hypothetical protein
MINLGSLAVEDAAYSALGKGLNCAVFPAVLTIQDFLTGVEKAIVSLQVGATEEAWQETVRILKASSRDRDNLSGTERRAERSLRTNTDLTVPHADKGNATVDLNTKDYNEKISVFLRVPTYRRLAKEQTEVVERKTTLLLKKSSLPEEIVQHLRPQGCRPLRLYGLLKIHKEEVPLRRIVSTIGAPTYRLAQSLAGLLGALIGDCTRHVRNSHILVSSDVVSLLNMVHIEEVLRLLSRHFNYRPLYWLCRGL